VPFEKKKIVILNIIKDVINHNLTFKNVYFFFKKKTAIIFFKWTLDEEEYFSVILFVKCVIAGRDAPYEASVVNLLSRKDQ
jgi:hypothetical protein